MSGIGEALRAALERERVPGAAAGVLLEGAESYDAAGVTSIEHPLPVDADTLFQAGSITKTVTAAAIVRLEDAGRIGIDEPVRRYLPGLSLADDSAAAALTLRHLLTHTAGFTGDWYVDSGGGDDAVELAIARLGELEQLRAPGTHYSYCNPAFVLLGRVIEVVTGSPFHVAIGELVLAPAGMDRSTFLPVEAMTERFAAGHSVSADRIEVVRPWTAPRMMGPAGGLITSVRELLRYARHHLDDPALARMREPLVETGGAQDAVGLAWNIRDVAGVRLAAHGGDMRGHASLLVLAPERRAALAISANAQTGHAVTAAVQRAWLGSLGLRTVVPDPVDGPLEDYAGRYVASISDLELAPDGHALVLRTKVHRLVPGSRTTFPEPEPSRVRLYAPDRLIGVAGPLKGSKLEAIRGADGQVAWLRAGGRLRRKVG